MCETVSQIENMGKEDFHTKIIKNFAQMTEFGHLVTFGAEDLAPEEKERIYSTLKAAGLNITPDITDDELDEIAGFIANRSVKVR